MKKVLVTLIALAASMSMNAQNAKIMKVLDGETVLDTYDVKTTLKVVFDDAPAYGTGTAKRTGNIDVKWIQLWKDGPKFAEYNVGAANNKSTDIGYYFGWGGSHKNGEGIDWVDDHNTGPEDLSGDNDTATNLWGNNWRMPTKAELDDLLAKCTVEWTDNYNETGVKGRIFTGKADYASNSVFLPAAGYCNFGYVHDQGDYGYYWSSTPVGSDLACNLYFNSGNQLVYYGGRYFGYSVRAVLVENIK